MERDGKHPTWRSLFSTFFPLLGTLIILHTHTHSRDKDVLVHVCMLSLQLCPTLCDPMDRSPPGLSVHGILQARILEWVAMPFSR